MNFSTTAPKRAATTVTQRRSFEFNSCRSFRRWQIRGQASQFCFHHSERKHPSGSDHRLSFFPFVKSLVNCQNLAILGDVLRKTTEEKLCFT